MLRRPCVPRLSWWSSVELTRADDGDRRPVSRQPPP
jgi:hypothetical protein